MKRQTLRRPEPSMPARPRWWRHEGRARAVVLAGVLVALVVTAYAPAFDAGFIWDDDDYVTRNVTVRTFDGLRRIWAEPGAVPQYYPVVHTSFWIEYHLWGLWAPGYHAVNIALHAINAVLLWLVLRRLAVPGAWLAAAVFAVHPVQVESVAWITERKNVLSGCFYLGALLVYLRACRVGGKRELGSGAAEEHRHAYASALTLFAAALLSKTVTGSLPVVILLLLWWKRGRLDARAAAALVPFFVLAGVLGGVTIWMERHRVGAGGPDWTFSIVDRCLIAGRALWFYAGKLVWPVQLTFVYPRWQVDSRVWWQYGFPLAAIVVLSGLCAMRARLGRGPLVAVLCFVVTLFPALGFIDVFPMRYTFVADHYQYLASIALIAAGVGVCSARWPRWVPSGTGAAAAAILLLVLSLLTWRQASVYRSLETLWRDTLAKNPGCWMAHDNFGVYWHERGQLEEAMRHYRAALRLKPDDEYAHGNLANALAAGGRQREAIAEYETALRLDPGYADAHNNLGNVLAAAGQLDAAIDHYESAIRSRPTYADAYGNLANVLATRGQTALALSHYEAALRIDPDYAAAHRNLGLLLADLGRTREAIAQLQDALRLAPDDAAVRAQLDRLRGAVQPVK